MGVAYVERIIGRAEVADEMLRDRIFAFPALIVVIMISYAVEERNGTATEFEGSESLFDYGGPVHHIPELVAQAYAYDLPIPAMPFDSPLDGTERWRNALTSLCVHY